MFENSGSDATAVCEGGTLHTHSVLVNIAFSLSTYPSMQVLHLSITTGTGVTISYMAESQAPRRTGLLCVCIFLWRQHIAFLSKIIIFFGCGAGRMGKRSRGLVSISEVWRGNGLTGHRGGQ
jgi:hypothetical protein